MWRCFVLQLYFLGTGAGLPTKHRNVSSLILAFQQPHSEIWLFDCGEATQHQLLRSPFRPSRLTRIWITHLHGDHLFGLPGLLSSLSFQDRVQSVSVYGPKGLRAFLDTALQTSHTHLPYPLSIYEMADGDTWTFSHYHVTVRRLEHGIPSYGFRVEEAERPGTLDAARLQALGVPPGPLYGRLKRGETVQLPNGQVLDGKAFIGPPQPGRKVAILGDTRPTPAAVHLARCADVLVHEATFSSQLAEHAATYFHSTTVQAAEIARRAQARALILTHFSSRYTLSDHDRLQQEAETVFRPVYIAQDHWSYEVASP